MGIVGVDEAGRGPVLGSLFVGAVSVADRADLPADVADSKTLGGTRRRQLMDELEADPSIRTDVVEIPPEEIDRYEGSLTEQVAEAFAKVIDRLAVDETSVAVDTGEADTDRFSDRIERFLSTSVDLHAAVRADETDPAVSAASIVAKEARETHVAVLQERFGNAGSGYPSDPTTRQFLADYVETHGDLPACARRSWATSQEVLAAVEQADLDEFVDSGRD